MGYYDDDDRLPASALNYTLQALIPYTRANIKLVFIPRLFFSDLEKISKKNRQTLRNAYYKAQKSGLIELSKSGVPRLTDKGKRRIKPFNAKKQPKGSLLMVAFDIPEAERWKRRQLRLLLRELSFTQVQKSLWASKYDHKQYLVMEIKQNGLENYVALFEASTINIK